MKKVLSFSLLTLCAIILLYFFTNHIFIKYDNKIVNSYLCDKDIQNTKIITLGTYTDLTYKTSEDENIENAVNNLFRKICDNSTFKIDEDEIVNFSTNILNDYSEIAYIHGAELDEYYKKSMHLTKEEFFEFCYNESLFTIEKALVIGAISEKENIIISDNDIKTFLKSNNISFKEYEDNDSIKNEVNYNILERKIINFLKKQ